MRSMYDAIIVGAGGHGLATAYYLGKNYGITNVAIIEKGWLGGGNTGRNTTIIRSNYLQDPSAAIYEKARSLYETMSQDLNYNVMFSPRGVIMLAQTEHEVRGYERTAHANALQGVSTQFIGPEKVKQLLCEKVHTVSRSNRRYSGLAHSSHAAPMPAARSSNFSSPAASPARSASAAPGTTAASPKRKAYKLVAIGTSTGGPVALQRVLTQLPSSFPAPIVLIQHMPAAFTKAFADRLDKLCKIRVKEAEDGDLLRPGLALLAPGGKQMMVDGRGCVRILPGDERLNYKPCVDVTFGSAAKAYHDKVLAVVLTGMGADGREGARLLKQSGSQVWAQDEASCVIYGMPMAIVKANLSDAVYGLDDIGRHLSEACI